ncbi:DEAD/DEAH box helicase family protein [Peribacillus frigoritolerans]|uniref:DEAD/DEAH box helicase n=1 Tax=Peribacillus frigoritolerans TaxID=450367 RepID=UPI0039A19197
MAKKALKSKMWKYNDELTEVLTGYQIDALNIATTYINSKSEEQALIKMPTGTGKTIILGFLSHFYNKAGNVLIVTPSVPVKDHLIQELKYKLWEKFNLNALSLKPVIELFPRDIPKKINRQEEKSIYIATVKTLNDIKDDERFEVLRKTIDLIIFDEGHKEPAAEWKTAIRGMGKKVVLFTATPFRNDKSKFQLNKNYIYNLSLIKAQKQNYIRNVVFKEVEESNVFKFVDIVINEVKALGLGNNIKVILRFNDKNDIKQAFKYLDEKEEKVIAIHEEFSSDEYSNEDFMVSKVPKNIKNSNITFWLHQFKLIEGVDDNSFQILGLYDSFNDARSLVQQVGRIIRHNHFGSNTEKEEGLIIYNSSNIDQKKLWDDYLLYEEKVDKDKNTLFFNFSEFVESIINIHPEIIYSEKKFFQKITLNKNVDDYMDQFRLPLRTNAFTLADFNVNDLDNWKKILETFLFNKIITSFLTKLTRKILYILLCMLTTIIHHILITKLC